MKNLILLFLTFVLCTSSQASYINSSNNYYVSVDGNSNNNGLSEASPWNIEHAFETAAPGDIVYIKAGNYGNKRLIVFKYGTKDKPIKFIGYTTKINDIKTSNSSSYSFDRYKTNGENLDASLMPLLEGVIKEDKGQGKAITNKKDYIEFHNLMIQNYDQGIFSSGKNCAFNNIVIADIGDFDINNSYNTNYPEGNWGTKNGFANLTGEGIWLAKGHNSIIENCLIINCGARGIISVFSDKAEYYNNSIYCDNEINPTDYYFLTYGCKNNIMEGTKIYRIGNLSHFGHGLSIKVGNENNNYKNIEISGTGIEMNLRNYNNTLENIHVEGFGKGGHNNGALSGGIEVTNDSSFNTFINVSNNNGEGIVFSDWTEKDGNNGIDNAGHDNTFINCKITNVVPHSGAAIDFHWNSQKGRLTSLAYNNTFKNCTFDGANYLFKVDRVNNNNKFINCKIQNIKKGYRHSRFNENNFLELNVSFDNCEFKNVKFKTPN